MGKRSLEDGGAARSSVCRALGVVGAVLALSIGAQIEVWMEPVPMTLQTLALVAAAGLLGPGLGALATLLYIGLGVSGVPVLADGGTLPLAAVQNSNSTGYLIGFVLAAGLAGLARSMPPRRALLMALLFMAAHVVVLGAGAAWLAEGLGLGWRVAVEEGAMPYLLGGAAKSICAAAIVTRLRGGVVLS